MKKEKYVAYVGMWKWMMRIVIFSLVDIMTDV